MGHGYQGGILMAAIFIYGLAFGAVAIWCESLRPAMLAHGWIDVLGGLAGFLSHFLHGM